jgi:hypothetical protein
LPPTPACAKSTWAATPYKHFVKGLCDAQLWGDAAGYAVASHDWAPTDANRYLVRDVQRAIEAIEAMVRIHDAQEQDIYEYAVTD